MNERAVAWFRDLTCPRFFCEVENPEAVFRDLAAVAAWAEKQRKGGSSDHDELLTSANEDEPTLLLNLIMHLATLDGHFFELAKRMMARTLVRNQPDEMILNIAAHLLTSTAPKRPRPQIARDVVLIVAIAVGGVAGWRPTESSRSPAKESAGGRSACARLKGELSEYGVNLTYDAIEKVWKKRREKLVRACFGREDIDSFLSLSIFLMRASDFSE